MDLESISSISAIHIAEVIKASISQNETNQAKQNLEFLPKNLNIQDGQISLSRLMDSLDLSTDFEQILNKTIQFFQDLTQGKFTALTETDPAIILLELIAFRDLTYNLKIGTAVHQTFIRTCSSGFLARFAEDLNITRKENENLDEFRTRVLIANSANNNGSLEWYYSVILALKHTKTTFIDNPPRTPEGHIHIYTAGEINDDLETINKQTRQFIEDNHEKFQANDFISVKIPTVIDYNVIIDITFTALLNIASSANVEISDVFPNDKMDKIIENIRQAAGIFAIDSFRLGKDCNPYVLHQEISFLHDPFIWEYYNLDTIKVSQIKIIEPEEIIVQQNEIVRAKDIKINSKLKIDKFYA